MNDTLTIPDVVVLDGTSDAGKDVLGGKAYSVNKMRALGLRVPPAFALPTPMCGRYHDNGGQLPDSVWGQVKEQVAAIETATGHTFGAGPSPLLVSVRSGAAQSMPGMMDTVLNLGLTPELVEVLASQTGDREWAEDTWARFRKGYADIVCGDPAAAPPADPWEQLRAAIGAVFDSWNNERVKSYRARHNLGLGGGTAVTVQAMVFGNRDANSATGVLFSRDPGTGSPELFGEWLPRAQGEDVVSGEATPEPLSTLQAQNPDLYQELVDVAELLEREHTDLVDIEFTVESGNLYILQSRAGKRSAAAAVRIAVELANEGLIDETTAVGRVTAEQLEAARSAAGVAAGAEVVARGLGAGPGVASGIGVTDPDLAMELSAAGTPFVLVRPSTAPEDVPVMFESVAIVTETGGSTSHAALVAREIGLPCVVGAGAGVVDALTGTVITVDGAAGVVYAGEIEGSASEEDEHVATLLEFAARTGDAGRHLLAPAAGSGATLGADKDGGSQ